MSAPEVGQPPRKKRRFFVDDPEPESLPSICSPRNGDASSTSTTSTNGTVLNGSLLHSSQTGADSHDVSSPHHASPPFEQKTFETFMGDTVARDDFERLREVSGNNMERAINMFLDGSWAKDNRGPSTVVSGVNMSPNTTGLPERATSKTTLEDKALLQKVAAKVQLMAMPDHRYAGAFGVGAWATKSGAGIVKIGDPIKIERTKIKPPVKIGRGGKPMPLPKLSAARMRTDVIVRFTNMKGEEIGRLPKEAANWVSTLMDQKVCRFDGTCFFAPERIRVNDTIELQIRCQLLRQAFEAAGFVKPSDNNRTTGIFEEKETSEEKDLRLRQVALVKLFDQINLQPVTLNDTTAKHKREGILQAAEIAEQYDKEKSTNKPASTQEGPTPPEDEAEEEGKELEQDQLDSLYKKAQSFDFDMPTCEPANTFIMNLRKYQKQALHWMMSKEKDEKSENKESSMHPLWEEYTWPTKDMDDQDLPSVIRQESFYVNPYSGEMSLEFPVQEHHCLGGVLADGERSSHELKHFVANIPRNGTW